MKRVWMALAVWVGLAAPGMAEARAPLAFSIVKTSEMETQEGLVVAGGDLFKKVQVVHTAVLVKHPRGTFLFDTGLGRGIDAQFNSEMPLWVRPFLAYGPVTPARDQLDKAGVPPVETLLASHAHWDHVSGLVDFPEAKVWVTSPEWDFMAHAQPPQVLRSQVDAPGIQYRFLSLPHGPYAGYPKSFDVFEDGSAVIVPMPGHTPGATGLFLTTGSGQRFFFVGDTVWSLEGVKRQQPKFWAASLIVDHDAAGTDRAIAAVRAVMEANPDLHIIPAHDGAAQAPWGYFPRWVE